MNEHEHAQERVRQSDRLLATSREIIGEPVDEPDEVEEMARRLLACADDLVGRIRDEMAENVVETHAPGIERPGKPFGLGFGELDASRITQALSEPERAERAARWSTWAILLACAGLLYAVTLMGR